MAGQSALWLECALRTMGAGVDFVDAREEGGERPRAEDHVGAAAYGQVERNTVKYKAACFSCGQGGLGPQAVQCMVMPRGSGKHKASAHTARTTLHAL